MISISRLHTFLERDLPEININGETLGLNRRVYLEQSDIAVLPNSLNLETLFGPTLKRGHDITQRIVILRFSKPTLVGNPEKP